MKGTIFSVTASKVGFCALIGLFCFDEQASAQSEPVFTIKPPPGFETDVSEERTLIDIYVDGKKVGSSPAIFDGMLITFEDPAGLATFVPALRDYEQVTQALTGPLPLNTEELCDPDAPAEICGILHPEVAGVIFDSATLRADLFVNELYSYIDSPNTGYLPPPTKAFGAIAGFDSRVFYDFDRNRLTGNGNLKFISGYGRTNFQSDIYVATGSGGRLNTAAFFHVGKRYEWGAGALPYRFASNLVRSSRLIGVRYGTTLKTRLDKDRLNASLIPISVASTAKVEIIRDGQILDVQRVEPGQSAIDASRLPRGSYNVTLRVEEDRGIREEDRFFTSGSNLPPSRETQWFVEAGLPSYNRGRNKFFPDTDANPILNTGFRKRLSPTLGIGLEGSLGKHDQYAELSVDWLGANHDLSAGILGSAKGDYGFFLRGRISMENWTLSANYRELVSADNRGIDFDGEFDPFPQSFRQAGANFSYRLAKGSIGLRGFYRRSSSGGETYFGGPYINYTLLENQRMRIGLSAQAETGNSRTSYFAGLRLTMKLANTKDRRRSSLTSYANIRRDKIRGSSQTSSREIAEISYRISKKAGRQLGTDYLAAIRYEDSRLGMRGAVNTDTSFGRLDIDGRYNYQRQTNMLVSASSAIAFGDGQVGFANRFAQSGFILAVKGSQNTAFNARADGANRAVVHEGQSSFVPLRPFDIQDVSIQPRSFQDIEYEHHADRLVIYPGNVPLVSRKVKRVRIVIGSVVDQAGAPIANAVLYSDRLLGTSDDSGFFQIDLTDQQKLTFKKGGDTVCTIDMSAVTDADRETSEYLNAGELTCRK